MRSLRVMISRAFYLVVVDALSLLRTWSLCLHAPALSKYDDKRQNKSLIQSEEEIYNVNN